MDEHIGYQDMDWSQFTLPSAIEGSSRPRAIHDWEKELHVDTPILTSTLAEPPGSSFSALSQPSHRRPAPLLLDHKYNPTVPHPVDSAFGPTPTFGLLDDSSALFPSSPDAMLQFPMQHAPSPCWATPHLPFNHQSAPGTGLHPGHADSGFNTAPYVSDNHFPVPNPDQGASRRHSTPVRPSRSQVSTICTVQTTINGRTLIFQCAHEKCRGKTFRRWYDFNRHFNGAHAVDKTVFWCPIAECNRSEDIGNRPFPRRDKMMDHVEKIHGMEEDELQEFGDWED